MVAEETNETMAVQAGEMETKTAANKIGTVRPFYATRTESSQHLVSQENLVGEGRVDLIDFRESDDQTDSSVFNNLLIDLSLDSVNTLRKINKFTKYSPLEQRQFMLAMKVYQDSGTLGASLIFEIFIKIHLHNKITKNSLEITDINHEATNMIRNLADKHINIERDGKINILAFIVSKITTNQINSAIFKYDIYYYIEIEFINQSNFNRNIIYEMNQLNQNTLINWSKATESKYKFINETNEVLLNQIKHMSNASVLVTLLENLRNYEYVWIKIDFIQKNCLYCVEKLLIDVYLNGNRVVGSNSNKLGNSLENITGTDLATFISPKEKKSGTNYKTLIRILKKLDNFPLLINFIRKTGCTEVSRLFYDMANNNKIQNCYFVEALIINLEELHLLNETKLQELVGTCYLIYILDEYKNYKRTMRVLVGRKMINYVIIDSINKNPNKSLRNTNQTIKKIDYLLGLIEISELEKITEKDGNKTAAQLLNRMYQKEIRILLEDHNVDFNTKTSLINIFMGLRNPKYLDEVFKITGSILINRIKHILEDDTFNTFVIELIRSLIRKNICVQNIQNSIGDEMIRNILENSGEMEDGHYLRDAKVEIETKEKEFTLILLGNNLNELVVEFTDEMGMIETYCDMNVGDRMQIQYKNKVLKTTNKQISMKNIRKIVIKNRTTNHVLLKQLFYYEVAIDIDYPKNETDLYQLYVKPLMKLLEFHRKNGVAIRKHIVNLSKENVQLKMHNVMALQQNKE
ncbi:hypothetical protein ECANGB1_1898 [Enterospora canceri]|uniref:Uncharacterized protein n=1 Tax=Enterospora canceri TaxID=1081671 RepID=A0A1Y1S9R8_9MICR|nr:hypothetical protein ECANGB1_1898 [Enterospora canceri]